MKKLLSTFIVLLLLRALPASGQLPPYLPTSSLLGWWSFTGNTIDSSGNGYTFTNNGAALASDRFNRPNCAYSFSGDAAGNPFYLYMNPNPLNGYQEYSISFWFQRDAGTDSTWIMDLRSPATPTPQYSTEFQSDPYVFKLISYIHSPVNAPLFDIRDSLAINANDWYHVVMTFDSLVTRLYVNGILAGVQNTTPQIIPHNGPWYVGKHLQSATIAALRDFEGRIDDIGMWSRALTVAEINGLFTGQVQVPASCDSVLPVNLYQNLIGYYPFCGNWNDYSGANNHFGNTNLNIPSFTTDRFGRPDNALFFNGTNSTYEYLKANTPLFNDTTSFSIAYWFQRTYNTAPAGTWMMEMRSRYNPPRYTFEFWSNNNQLQFINYIRGNNISVYKLEDFLTIDPAVWYCVTVTSQNGLSKMFLNGILVDTDTVFPIVPRNDYWYIGWNSAFPQQPTKSFNGKLDDIFVWNRALSDAEVVQLCGYNPLGLNPPEQTGKIITYPNPTSGRFSIELGDLYSGREDAVIRVLDVPGQQVATFPVEGRTTTIDLRNLSPGIYFVYIHDRKGNRFEAGKIVKQ